jgi:hypothetical protein
MTEQRPDTDDRGEPGGTSSPGPAHLVDAPVTPGTDDGPKAVPGAYEADDAELERGMAVKPVN